MKRKFKEIKIGLEKKKLYRVVCDMRGVPQGLYPGTRFVSTKDMRYVDKTFPKGTEMVFVDYAVKDWPSSRNEYDFFLYRVALFRFKGDRLNRQAGADDIEKEG